MSFETVPYLEPYELYLQHVKIEEDVYIGQTKNIDISAYRFEKIWFVASTVEQSEMLSKVQVFSKATEKSFAIMSSWISDDHSVNSARVTTDIWGIGRREWEGLLTQPFWRYLLEECLFHIEQNNYHVAILLSATAVEWFVNKFLDYHLKNDKGWSNTKVKKYLEDFTALPSLTHKIELLGRSVLEIDYDNDVYGEWSNKVRHPRNAIIHGTEDMHDQYQWSAAISAVIAASNFISEFLDRVPSDKYLEGVKTELRNSTAYLNSILEKSKG